MKKSALLIVDDQSDSADILGVLLELHLPDAEVIVAYGGQAALDRAARHRPEAAVLDLEMPGMDGEALARALRQKFADHPPLLIALSGNVFRLAEIRGNGLFDHHLSKPVNSDAVVRLLADRLSS